MAIEPSYAGKRTCIGCGKTFESPDKMRIRRCNKCKERERKDPLTNRTKIYAYRGPNTSLD